MANRDNPHGLHPLMRTMGGGVPRVDYFAKVVGYGTALFIGDAVFRVADGSIDKSGTPGTTAYSGVNLNWGAASTATNHVVIISPNALFEAQDNNDSDGTAEADMGLNANLELNAGSATTLISGHEIDESTENTTSTLDVHLLGKLNVPDNAYGGWCRVEIMFNKHRMAPATAGI